MAGQSSASDGELKSHDLASDALSERVCEALDDLAVTHEIYAYPCEISTHTERMFVATSIQTRSGAAYFVQDCHHRFWLVLRQGQDGAGLAQSVNAKASRNQFNAIMNVLTEITDCRQIDRRDLNLH